MVNHKVDAYPTDALTFHPSQEKKTRMEQIRRFFPSLFDQIVSRQLYKHHVLTPNSFKTEKKKAANTLSSFLSRSPSSRFIMGELGV